MATPATIEDGSSISSGLNVGSEKKGDAMPATATTAAASLQFEYSQEEVTKLIRKIDWRIMPYLWGYAVLSAVDVRYCIRFP